MNKSPFLAAAVLTCLLLVFSSCDDSPDTGNGDGAAGTTEYLRVISTSPDDGGTVNSLFPTIIVTFDADLDETKSAGYGSVQILDFEGNNINSTRTVSGKTITVTADNRVPDGVHTVKVTTEVKSLTDTSLEADYTFSITTATDKMAAFFKPAPGTTGPGFYHNPPVLDSSNNVFIGTSSMWADAAENNNYFYKLNADLNVLDSYSLGTKEIRGGAALDSSGNLYFVVVTNHLGEVVEGSDDGGWSTSDLYLYKLDSNLDKLWEYKILDNTVNSGILGNWGMISPALSADDSTVYVGGYKFHAVNTSDGSLKWSYTPNGSGEFDAINTPVIDDAGYIYFVGCDTSESNSAALFCLQDDGAAAVENWVYTTEYSTNQYFGGVALNNAADKAVFGAEDKIYYINTADGSLDWSYDLATPPDYQRKFFANPVIDSAGKIYFGSKANNYSTLYALTPGTGSSTLEWSWAAATDLYSAPCIGNDGHLYITTEGSGSHNKIVKIDKTDGSVIWSSDIPYGGSFNFGGSAIGSNGRFYAANMDQRGENVGQAAVYAFEIGATAYETDAFWPTHHGTNAGTGRAPAP